jgi:hypothetical protein
MQIAKGKMQFAFYYLKIKMIISDDTGGKLAKAHR